MLAATSLDPRRRVADPHEGAVPVVGLERLQRLRGAEGFLETGLHRDMNAAREGTGMRHEIELCLDPRRELRAGDDFRDMAMTQGTVGVQIAVPQRMMRAFNGLAAGAGAAGDAGHEQPRIRQPQCQQRHGREQCGGRKASGMCHMRRRRLLHVFRHGAAEFPDSRRRAMRVLVHRLIRGRARIAEVGRDIDAVDAGTGRFGRRQQTVDDGGGHPVGRGGKTTHTAARCG